MRVSVILTLILLFACSTHEQQFELISSNNSGITFINTIPENDVINILSFEYIYNGGGVASADFNQDGFQDLFFVGNAVDNQLYLNKGNLKFGPPVSMNSISAPNKWCTGVNILDINADGWPDIYLGVNSFNTNENPNNLLFIHQGLDDDGNPIFEEKAAEYGIQGGKHTMHSAFLDYDLDGDLDLYILNNVLDLMSPTDYRDKQLDGQAPNSDQLFRNNGDGSFTEITVEAGIVIEGYGLGLAISDINKDGYPDIYVANDYITNDILYINQGDGTFKNEISTRLKKQSKFSMGAASADLNNDGSNEFFVLDMLAYDNERLKKLNGSSQYNNVLNNRRYNYEEQNIRNMLQLNRGDGTFLEIAYKVGLHASDWSWTPLCEDFDNDGDVDIYVTNGFPKDVTDLDFINFKANRNMSFNRKDILNEIPEIKIPNQYYKNNGSLDFAECSEKEGLDKPSFSNGAIAVDLDNDGDLDIVTNNINQEAFLYENKSAKKAKLKVEFQNSDLIGTKIYYYYGDTLQYKEYFPHKSYLTSAPPYIYFASESPPDSVRIVYPNLVSEVFMQSEIKATLTLNNSKGSPYNYPKLEKKASIPDTINEHQPYFDANLQTTILTDYSHQLPRILLSHDDSYQMIDGKPIKLKNTVLTGVTNGAYLDENRILYSTASYQNPKTAGSLIMVQDDQAISSTFDTLLGQFNVLKPADYNKDGLLDLFLGGGYRYGQYPLHYPHYLATQKEDGNFILKEIPHTYAIQDAEWADIDGDSDLDLLLTGHWQGLALVKNNGGTLAGHVDYEYFTTRTGLYFEIATDDINKDGKADIVLGNMGTNTQLRTGPVAMIAEDFDKNGVIDPLAFFKYGNSVELVPLDLKDDLISQVPMFKKRFTDYTSYTQATIDSFIDRESTIYRAEELRSLILLSNDNGYELQPLPTEVQFSPVIVGEFLGDTLFMGGNISFGREFWGSYSSSDGHWFIWDGEKFQNISDDFPRIAGDLRSAAKIGGQILIGRNRDEIIAIQ